jgi:hypothetical protein
MVTFEDLGGALTYISRITGHTLDFELIRSHLRGEYGDIKVMLNGFMFGGEMPELNDHTLSKHQTRQFSRNAMYEARILGPSFTLDANLLSPMVSGILDSPSRFVSA